MATQPITIGAPAKIFATGRGTYIHSGTAVQVLLIRVELFDATNTLVVRSAFTRGGSYGSDDAWIPLSIAEVLRTPQSSAPGAPPPVDYIAPADAYTLKLSASINGGSCAATPTLDNPVLSFLLVGTS